MSTTPTPKRVSNAYECLTNENDESDNAGHGYSSSTSNTTTVPSKETTHKGGKNKKKTPSAKNKAKTRHNAVTGKGVTTPSTRNTGITNKQSVPSVATEVGTVEKTDNGKIEENIEDDISTMTGSTESATRKINISDIFLRHDRGD